MIQINDVVKSFDGFRALDGLTMKVEEGSIYGLVRRQIHHFAPHYGHLPARFRFHPGPRPAGV